MTEEERQAQLAADWHHPLGKGSSLLYKVLDGMQDFKLSQDDVPLIIKLTENPNYATARFFGGAVSLFSHDCIHREFKTIQKFQRGEISIEEFKLSLYNGNNYRNFCRISRYFKRTFGRVPLNWVDFGGTSNLLICI